MNPLSKGFAFVGSLWAFLCGAFAQFMVLGMVRPRTSMQILFGTKDFPVVHRYSTMFDLKFRCETPLCLWLDPKFVEKRQRRLALALLTLTWGPGFRVFMANFVVDFGPIESSAMRKYCHDSRH